MSRVISHNSSVSHTQAESCNWNVRNGVSRSTRVLVLLRCVILICIALVQGATQIQAQLDYGFDFEKTGSAGFQALKIAIGARESALGEAGQ